MASSNSAVRYFQFPNANPPFNSYVYEAHGARPSLLTTKDTAGYLSVYEWVAGEGAGLPAAGGSFGLGVEVPPPTPRNHQAFKADDGKPRFELLMDGMPNALLDVAKVLTWAVQAKKDEPWPTGGKGYVPHSWQQVPEAKRRYRAALQRHENAIARGEINDPESGLPHRAHIATNALFLAELDHKYPEVK